MVNDDYTCVQLTSHESIVVSRGVRCTVHSGTDPSLFVAVTRQLFLRRGPKQHDKPLAKANLSFSQMIARAIDGYFYRWLLMPMKAIFFLLLSPLTMQMIFSIFVECSFVGRHEHRLRPLIRSRDALATVRRFSIVEKTTARY